MLVASVVPPCVAAIVSRRLVVWVLQLWLSNLGSKGLCPRKGSVGIASILWTPAISAISLVVIESRLVLCNCLWCSTPWCARAGGLSLDCGLLHILCLAIWHQVVSSSCWYHALNFKHAYLPASNNRTLATVPFSTMASWSCTCFGGI